MWLVHVVELGLSYSNLEGIETLYLVRCIGSENLIAAFQDFLETLGFLGNDAAAWISEIDFTKNSFHITVIVIYKGWSKLICHFTFLIFHKRFYYKPHLNFY